MSPWSEFSKIFTASEWVDKVAARSHYDPGWAGTEPMLAPDGSNSYELPWGQIQSGLTLVIPSRLQLEDFQQEALRELHSRFWKGRSQNSSVRVRDHSADTCEIAPNQLKEALRKLSQQINWMCRIPTRMM